MTEVIVAIDRAFKPLHAVETTEENAMDAYVWAVRHGASPLDLECEALERMEYSSTMRWGY